jgi:hypothetical protein
MYGLNIAKDNAMSGILIVRHYGFTPTSKGKWSFYYDGDFTKYKLCGEA